jgi:hypothetical protein
MAFSVAEGPVREDHMREHEECCGSVAPTTITDARS